MPLSVQRAAALDHAKKHDDNRDDQQDVNHAPEGVGRDDAEQPQDEKDEHECEDHMSSFRTNCRAVCRSTLFSCAQVCGPQTCHSRRMKITIAGVVLIVLGAAALLYQGIGYTSRETVVDIGPIHATADRERTLPLPPVVGIAAVAGGIILLVSAVRKRV